MCSGSTPSQHRDTSKANHGAPGQTNHQHHDTSRRHTIQHFLFPSVADTMAESQRCAQTHSNSLPRPILRRVTPRVLAPTSGSNTHACASSSSNSFHSSWYRRISCDRAVHVSGGLGGEGPCKRVFLMCAAQKRTARQQQQHTKPRNTRDVTESHPPVATLPAL